MPYYTEGKVLWLILTCIRRSAHNISHPGWQRLFEAKIEREALATCRIIIQVFPDATPAPAMQIVIYSTKKFRTDRVVKLIKRTLEPELIDVRESERKYVLCHKEK
jgi:hypothetical protein